MTACSPPFMARIAVFDSGLGSLSVIRAIQRAAKSDIIYFADQKSFPYGKKSKLQLGRIIQKTIKRLKEDFAPDVIVMASNTPSLVLGDFKGVIGVYPPLKTAAEISSTRNIAILGTKTSVASHGLDRYITLQKLPRRVIIHKIDASPLVELVEGGEFLTDKALCKKEIKRLLACRFKKHGIDTATLSSTHLPFLAYLLKSELGHVRFLDPADNVASKVAKRIKVQSKRNSLKIYASGDVKKFQNSLAMLGIRNRVGHLTV